MCGITGWIDWRRDLTGNQERELVQAMTATMACRGPNDVGTWFSPRAALGARRLAVIDLTGGAQPMLDVFDRPNVVLTYCGELYNYVELRDELLAHGHTFRNRCDTEVVLRAFMHWGADCVHRFEGMFAFAAWDAGRKELLLARDPLGIKPLYYHAYGEGVLFGSEPKALLANPLLEPEVDAEGLAEIFAMTPARTPGSGLYRGMREVRPGRVVRVSEAGIAEHTYWQPTYHVHPQDAASTPQSLRTLLDRSVRRQLVADVPTGVQLSGGVDSSAITALAARERLFSGGEKLMTFSVDFRDSARHFSPNPMQTSLDSPFVNLMARHADTWHTSIVLDDEDLATHWDAPLSARDMPSMGEMDVSLYLLCRTIRRDVTVVLSGEGADEVLGGYAWFRSAPEVARGFPWRRALPPDYDVRTPELHAAARFEEYSADRYHDALAEVPTVAEESEHDSWIRTLRYLSITRFLPSLLERQDRMSSAVGLEVRLPFCDHQLVDYVWNIPPSMQTSGGAEKSVLRQAVSDLLPAEIRNRPKSGYPSAQSPAHAAAVVERLRALCATPNAPIHQLIDRGKLRRIIDAAGGAAGLGYRLRPYRLLLDVDAWLRAYRVRVV